MYVIGKPTTPDYFWTKIDRTPVGCWNWTGSVNYDGYGKASVNHKTVGAHTLAYRYAVGDIPEGLWVLHNCDNRRCCRPSHLYVGTAKDNTQDMIRRGRKDFKAAVKNRDTRGEKGSAHKLTTAQVLDIRARYSRGRVTLLQLANEHGVTKYAVWAIITRRSWTHV